MPNPNEVEDIDTTITRLDSRVRFLRAELIKIRDQAECGAGLDSENRKAYLEAIYDAAENVLLVTEDKE